MTRTLTLITEPEPLTIAIDRTALIVVDMQNAYCSPGGYLDRVGFDVSGSAPVIAETRRIIDACKGAGMTIIYLQNGFEPDQRGHCHENARPDGGQGLRPCAQAAIVARSHCWAASALKRRSVRREIRWG